VTFTNKKLLIFDLDGTLIDSVPDLAEAINTMLKKLGKAPFSTDTIRGWVGNGAETLVKRALSGGSEINTQLESTLVSKALSIFLEAYTHNLCNTTRTYPHVKATLNTLKELGYTLSIVTNKPIAFVAPILKGLGLDGLFELILGGDSLAVKKPEPLPLLHSCEQLGFSISEALMIGDSKNDIVAANAANMESVGVTYGYNYGENINTFSPTLVIDDFQDLVSLLPSPKV